MGRKNRSNRARNGRPSHDHAPSEDIGMMTTDKMAQRLVRHGLATHAILDPRKDAS
jgi:hypothetical protein